MSEYSLLLGDAVQVMRGLPANSVQCCVTSPPYFGLRDYQTATWEGGDAECDHKQATARNDGGRVNTNGFHGSARLDSDKGAMNYRDLCGKCGARRIDNQIGLESSPEAYVAKLVEVFREVRRILHPSGVVFLNLGDSYNGSGGAGGDYSEGGLKEGQPKYPGRNVNGLGPKQLLGMPWRVAFALQADGWILRSEIIWHKRAPMPESVTDRPTKAHEQVFLLAKNATYYYDADAIREPNGDWNTAKNPSYGEAVEGIILGRKTNPHGGLKEITPNPAGRNKRSVWTLGPESYSGAHFATMPTKLVEPCILAGTSAKGCCAECGAPYERVTEHTPGDAEAIDRPKKTAGMNSKTSTLSLSGNGSKEWAERGGKRTTTGWAATCTCNADVVPCTVLDCFNGAATTGIVAIKHGRRYVGIDLNPEYLELSRKRLAQVQPLLFALEA